MEKKLTIEQLTDTLVRLTCEGGLVRNLRNGMTFAEVVCRAKEINDYGVA